MLFKLSEPIAKAQIIFKSNWAGHKAQTLHSTAKNVVALLTNERNEIN